MPESHKVLTQTQFYQLCKWLESLEQHELDGHTLGEVTIAAGKVLGFGVAPSTTKKAAKVAGITWKVPKRGASGVDGEGVKEHRARINKRFDEIVGLYNELTEKLERYQENHRELILRVAGVEQSVLQVATNTSELRGDVVRLGNADVNHARSIEDLQGQLLERRQVAEYHATQISELGKRLDAFAELLHGSAESIVESPPPNVQRFKP